MEEQTNWFIKTLRIRGTVAAKVVPRAIVLGLLAIGVATLYYFEPELPWDFCKYLVNNVAFNLILGLLLVFRTNTAYERFWEGRKAWGEMVINIRNSLREISQGAEAKTPEAAAARSQAMQWLAAFAIATKLHLRNEPTDDQLDPLLQKAQIEELHHTTHRPLLILRWLEAYNQRLPATPLTETLRQRLANLTQGVTTCERILNTPIPYAYAIFLRRLILIYCLILPFGVVENLQWGTEVFVVLVAFVLFGVEAIADEIEDPFGKDANDLPLDDLCDNILNELREIQAELDQGHTSPSLLTTTD